MIISNGSGQGGVAPARNVPKGAEMLKTVNRNMMRFNDMHKQFADQVERLPFDAHYLIALCAPRPVRLTNASRDHGAM